KVGLARGTQDWVWRKADEEWHPDCIDARKKTGNGVMFWGSFRWGCIGPGAFFKLEQKQKVNSSIYRDQILLGPLKDMWEESFGEVDPIVMEDGAPVHKKVCIPERENLGMETLPHPPNSPDLNPIENVWQHIKEVVSKDYPNISSKDELQRI